MRYYFHIRDGETSFDEEGMELSSLEAVRQEAILSSAEMGGLALRGSGQVSRGCFGLPISQTAVATKS
jgi:hypothetical protein